MCDLKLIKFFLVFATEVGIFRVHRSYVVLVTVSRISRTPHHKMGYSVSPVLFAAFLACALAVTNAMSAYKQPSGLAPLHSLTKKSFQDMQCKGMYEKTLFSKLEGVCEGCHRLYQDLDIPTLCRQRCFNNPVFFSCLDALLMKDEQENYQNMIEYIGGWRKK